MPHRFENHFLTISSLNAWLQRAEMSREAYVSQLLDNAQSLSAQHVFTRLYPEAALAAARQADVAEGQGKTLSPLAGLPISIKDLYDVAGETTWAGSLVCQSEAAAPVDAVAVARLRDAGAAIIGKTNMTEFAFSGVGLNPHWGTPRNPADGAVERIPGGSSSGAAVSVALGLAVAGLGSDTGGSIRIPAALCGLVGFKSTQSRIPRTGALELSRTLDTVCAITRSVADALTVDAVLAGEPLHVPRREAHSLRLAVPQTLVLDALDATVDAAFSRTLSRLSAAGISLVELPLPELAEISQLNAPGGFSAVEAYAVHHQRLASQHDAIDPRVAARIKLGQGVTAQQYLAMHDARRDWIHRVEASLKGFDAVICPTVPIVAPPLEGLVNSDEAFFRTNALLLRNTFVVNYLDGCSFSLPCHVPGELPVGLMLSSVGGDDARLAAVALAVEQILG